MKKIYLNSALYLLALILPLGCGSGGIGGGGDGGTDEFVGAARINLSVTPNSIDTRDRAQVKIKIQNVIDTGIVLKVRYPNELTYAAGTARLKLESDELSTAVAPSFAAQTTEWKYLVFLLPRSAFGDLPDLGDDTPSEVGELIFEIIGDARVKDGSVEADADVNDPTISDIEEFSIINPGFEAETEGSIEVRQSRG